MSDEVALYSRASAGVSCDHDVSGAGSPSQRVLCLETAPPGARQIAYERLRVRMRQVHEATHQISGSRRMRAELAEQGSSCGRKRVVRLMRHHGLKARHRRHRTVTADSQHSDPVAPNLLDRDFSAPAPNSKWVTDITGVWTAEGWL